MLITDDITEYLAEVKKFAKKIGMLDQLKGRLDYLANYSDQESRCRLFKDFAPHSFAFLMEHKKDGEWKPWYNGGLIFHGEHDGHGDGGTPTFSVCVTKTTGWSIHT